MGVEDSALATDPRVIARGWDHAMRDGDFQAAWRWTDLAEDERRRSGRAIAGQLLWDGRPWRGRDVLVRCLHGLGDTLQFARFLPAVAREAARLTVLAQPELLPLLRRHFPGVGLGNIYTDFERRGEVELEVMELAYALRASPGEHPVAWANTWRPGSTEVAVFWRSSAWDDSRSIPLSALAPVFATGARVTSYQLDAPPAERAAFPGPDRATPDVAALADRLVLGGLVVTVDGMSAHLAAALGVPTWILLKHNADWRWGSGPRSPWYPSARLFRQTRAGDWSAPVRALARCLAQRFSASGRREAKRTA